MQNTHSRNLDPITRAARWLRPLVILAIAVVVLALAVVIPVPFAVPASAAPLTDGCSPGVNFLAQGQGTPNTQLIKMTQTPKGFTFSDIGEQTHSYNAMGFNRLDGYLYATTADGNVLKVDPETGTVTETAMKFEATGGIQSGAISPDGIYYTRKNRSESDIERIDLTTGTLLPAIEGNDTIAQGSDFVFQVGDSRYLWGMSGHRLTRIDVTTGSWTRQTNLTDLEGKRFSGAFGAAFQYGNGDLGFQNNDGTIVRIRVVSSDDEAFEAQVVATIPGPTSSTNDGASCVGDPVDLSIEKSAPAALVTGNGRVTYQLTVTNSSSVSGSSGYEIIDTLPEELSNVSSTSPGVRIMGRTVAVLGGELPAGESATISFSADGPDTGCVTNSATVIGNEADPRQDNDEGSATTCFGVNLSTTKAVSASTAPVRAGSELTYTLTFQNLSATTATTVDHTDALSDVLDDAALISDIAVSESALTASRDFEDELRITGTLEAGQTVTVSYTVTVSADGDRGNSVLRNFLIRSGEPVPAECDPSTQQCTQESVEDAPPPVTTPSEPASARLRTPGTGGDVLNSLTGSDPRPPRTCAPRGTVCAKLLTEPSATGLPATGLPATGPPATGPPATEPSATGPPATEPSATGPPATEPSATEPSATEPPIVLPNIATANPEPPHEKPGVLPVTGANVPFGIVMLGLFPLFAGALLLHGSRRRANSKR